jgi:CBS domain-containing membrane protein
MPLALRRLLPDLPPVSLRERLRAAAGALFGILATGLVCRAALGADSALPALIAPMGASAVLLFAVPASPLAQPWSILGGNLVASLAGVTAAIAVADPAWAAALAVGAAIALMLALRCLHPPSGAIALTAVLGGPAIHDLGYGFVLWPVAANSALMLAAALLFNNLTGRSYPHLRPAPDRRTADPAPAARVGFSAADLDAALRDFDQLLDVGRGDLEAILRRVQMRVYGRRAGAMTCAAIMSRDVIAVAPDDPLSEALRLLRRHRVKALPVTDEGARVLGILTQTDLLDKAAWDERGPRLGLRRRLRLTLDRGRAPHGVVADIMSPVRPVRPETPLADLVLAMSEAGLHHLPVVGADDRLVGIVSQTDLVPALMAEAAGRSRDASPERTAGAATTPA